MGYESWSIGALWSELEKKKEQLKNANAKRERLEKALSAVKKPKSTCEGVKKTFQSSSFIDNCGEWKGKRKDEFVGVMTDLGKETKKAWDRIDEFHDEIDKELYKAKLASGRYAPVVSEIKALLNKIS